MTDIVEKIESLKSRVLGASLWSLASVGLANILRLGGNLIVTRLLVPEMFGVMAVVLAISTVVHLMSDIGLHQSVLRHPKGNDPLFLNTVWSVQVLRGFLLWIVTVCLGVVLWLLNTAEFIPSDSTYGSPVLPLVLAVSGLGAAIRGFHSTKFHTAVRQLELREVVVLELGQQFVTIASMIIFAWLTGSIWAIVIAGLLGDLAFVALSYVLWPHHRNRWAWDPDALRDLVKFGRWLFLSSAIGVLGFNADRLLLAGFADATYMGFYAVALGLAGAMTAIFDKLFASVILPALTETVRKDPSRLVDVYISVRNKLDPWVLVFGGLLFALGPLIIDVLYDERYKQAGFMLAILSLGMLITRYQICGLVYFAIDKPEYHALLNTVRVISAFTMIPAALHFGGLPWGLLAIALREAPIVPVIFWLNARHGLNSWRAELMVGFYWPIGFAVGWLALAVVGRENDVLNIVKTIAPTFNF